MRDKNKIPTENDMTMLEAFLEPCYNLYSFNKNIK